MNFFRHAGADMDRIFARLADWIVHNPLRSIIGSIVVVLLAAIGITGYHYSLDHRVFFSPENPQLQAYEKLHADYSKTDAILIVLAPSSGTVFNREFLAVLKDTTERSWKVPYSQRVESLTNFQQVTVDGDKATAQFRQYYASGALKTTTRKTLRMQREKGQWRITHEGTGS